MMAQNRETADVALMADVLDKLISVVVTMKRIAAPMVGGMVTSTILTLVVIPAIYSLWKENQLRSVTANDSRKV